MIKIFDEYKEEYEFKDEIKTKESVKFILEQPKIKLLPDQEEVAQFLLNNDNCINNSSIGYGKTAISLITAITLKKLKNYTNCLIIVPSSLKRQWCEEITKFTNEKVNLIEGPKKKRIYRSNAFFTITSYELTIRDIALIKDIAWDVLLCDEIVRIKNEKTLIAKTMKQINVKKKICLTGAVLENKIEELFNIINFTKPETFYSYTDFAKRFLIRTLTCRPWAKYYEITGYKNLDALKELMKDFVIRRKLTDLPIKNEKTYVIDMNEDQRFLYDKFRKDCYEELVAENSLAKTVYLREICNDPRLIEDEAHGEKIYELLEILKSIDGKCVLFTQFKTFGDTVYKELNEKNYKVEFVHGGLSSKEKDDIITKWKTKGTILLATDCLSYGLNLQEASVLVNLDIPWNPMKLQQRIGRIYRRGQVNGCLIINLIMKDSIEEQMLDYINKKIDLINAVTDDNIDTFDISNDKVELLKMLKGDK